MKIGITADCSSGLEYFPRKHNVKITRTTIHFGDETLIDGVDITADGFYERLKNSDIIPTTSAPTPGEIMKRVEEWKKEGCTDIIHFPISFGLSAYGENLQAIGKDIFDGVNFYVFDTKTACIMEGYIAYYAQILANKGYSIENIFSECSKLRQNTCAFFVVDDLKYLVKNGRLSTAAGFVGSLAGIKPVLELNREGKIVTYEKVRTHKKAINRLVEIIKERSEGYKRVLYLVQHTGCLEAAQELAERMKREMTNAEKVEISTITPTVGAHIGCGVLGMARIVLDNLAEEL
ncbi:MAG TPA: DegV family protein [Bacilli bacterium]